MLYTQIRHNSHAISKYLVQHVPLAAEKAKKVVFQPMKSRRKQKDAPDTSESADILAATEKSPTNLKVYYTV